MGEWAEISTLQISLRSRGGCWIVKGDKLRYIIWSSLEKSFETEISSAYTSMHMAGTCPKGMALRWKGWEVVVEEEKGFL